MVAKNINDSINIIIKENKKITMKIFIDIVSRNSHVFQRFYSKAFILSQARAAQAAFAAFKWFEEALYV